MTVFLQLLLVVFHGEPPLKSHLWTHVLHVLHRGILEVEKVMLGWMNRNPSIGRIVKGKRRVKERSPLYSIQLVATTSSFLLSPIANNGVRVNTALPRVSDSLSLSTCDLSIV